MGVNEVRARSGRVDKSWLELSHMIEKKNDLIEKKNNLFEKKKRFVWEKKTICLRKKNEKIFIWVKNFGHARWWVWSEKQKHKVYVSRMMREIGEVIRGLALSAKFVPCHMSIVTWLETNVTCQLSHESRPTTKSRISASDIWAMQNLSHWQKSEMNNVKLLTSSNFKATKSIGNVEAHLFPLQPPHVKRHVTNYDTAIAPSVQL